MLEGGAFARGKRLRKAGQKAGLRNKSVPGGKSDQLLAESDDWIVSLTSEIEGASSALNRH
jgi:hypothetical protein